MVPFPIHLTLTIDTVHSRCNDPWHLGGEVVNKGRMAVAIVQLKLHPFCTCDVTCMLERGGASIVLLQLPLLTTTPCPTPATIRNAILHMFFAQLYPISNSPILKVVSTLEKRRKELQVREELK